MRFKVREVLQNAAVVRGVAAAWSAGCPHRRRGNSPVTTSALALASALTAMTGPAAAQNWIGMTSTDWTVGSNWDSGVAPTSTTDAFIDTTAFNRTVIGVSGAVNATSGIIHIGDANGSSGNLTIQNGATLTTSGSRGVIAANPGSNGVVTVTGVNSSWTISGILSVGSEGTGSLTIAGGGAVTSASGRVGSAAGSTGSITVTGAGSTWSNSGSLTVGGGFSGGGTGTLTIADGGMVDVGGGAGTVVVGGLVGSTGTLNIGAAPGDAAVAPGTLNATTVQFGPGTGALNFNHTATGYVFAPTITGPGAVNQIAGTTILTANSTYTGGTTISGGVLQLGNGSTTGSIVGDVTNDGTLAFSRSDDIPFGGAISGSGNVVQMGPGILTPDRRQYLLGRIDRCGGNGARRDCGPGVRLRLVDRERRRGRRSRRLERDRGWARG
ncbi:MAG: hypothetical protein GEU95_02935 [Rhizobiales bacterium]|nr:hypothetical protein [Hyphomicrobiales bacterium]